MKKFKLKGRPKKVWDFLWKEDSVASWAVNIVLAFILVKFLIYPLLGMMFGTALPIVAVVSGSMDHDASFDDWWVSKINSTHAQGTWYMDEGREITSQQFKLYPLSNGFSKGDVIVLTGSDFQDIKKGDVIVFNGGKQYPIIHRVVQIHDGYLETKGDGNPFQHKGESGLDELHIYPEQIIGKASFKIPSLGWIKIGASCTFNSFTGKPIPTTFGEKISSNPFTRTKQCLVANA